MRNPQHPSHIANKRRSTRPYKGNVQPPGNPNPPACPDPSKQITLTNRMRLVWQQHVYWVHMLLISISEKLDDQNAVTNRLLQNPNDIANIFASFYPMNAARTISQLLTEHLQIGSALITALRDEKAEQGNILNRQWHVNADKMAHAFSSINPYYDKEDLRKMFYKHLELTTIEVSRRLERKYPENIQAFNKVEEEALMMADYFASGIMKQFSINMGNERG